jgi:hypothetical protein
MIPAAPRPLLALPESSRLWGLIPLLLAASVHAQEPAPAPPPATTTSPAPAEAPQPAELTPLQRFKRGKNLFEYGDCNGTVDVLAPLAVPGKLQDENDQLEVHRMLGVCYVLADKQLEGAREFSSLLSINPDYVLDPFLTPPNAIEVYERQKAAMAAQLEEIRRARDQARASGIDDNGGVLLEKTTVIKDVPLAAAFMPFGLAQAANGETVKAIVLGSIQGAMLAANVTMFWTTFGMAAQPEGQRVETQDKLTTYQVLWYGHIIAAMGLGLSYGYGVADALWNREDGAVVEKKQSRRKLTPEEIKALQKVAPQQPAPSASGAEPPPAAAPSSPGGR